MPPIGSITALVKRAAADASFDLAGISSARDFAEFEYFPQWIAENRHGEMRYLESRNEAGDLKRASLHNAAPWAQSVIVCAMNYNTGQPYSTEEHSPGAGWISRYAWGKTDYHDVLLPRLRQVEAKLCETAGDIRTWCYVDTGPVVERVFARHAGIGWIGKNACIINQNLGSWLFLGVILTSIELEPDLPSPERCGTCTRCLEACPTSAFLAPGKLDATRCISYLTIEKRGGIPEDLRSAIGRQVFGCDICQDVCPWNGGRNSEPHRQQDRTPQPTEMAEFQPRMPLVNPDLEWLATMNQEEFRETFRHSPVKRAKRTGLRRNAIIAMGNSRQRRFIPVLRRIIETDTDATLVEHAHWALSRLQEITQVTT